MTAMKDLRGARRRVATSLAAAGLAAVAAIATTIAPAHAVDPDPTTYQFNEYKVSNPLDVVCNQKAAPDGSMWFVEEGSTRLGRYDLQTGEVRKFPLPNLSLPLLGSLAPYPSTLAIGPCDLAFDKSGRLWFNFQQANVLGWIETQAPYRIHTVPLQPLAVPMSLATGADGHIYATLTGSNKIAEVDPDTEKVVYHDVPTAASGIIGGTAGRDGAQWFVELAADKVLRLDYATHQMKEYGLPHLLSGSIVIRWIQGALWFTEMTGDRVGRLDPATGQVTEVALPPLSVPISLVEGLDGDIYVDEAVGDKVARIDPQSMSIVAEYPIPTKLTFPEEITTGPDGAIWFPESLSGNLGRLWVNSFGTDPGTPAAPHLS